MAVETIFLSWAFPPMNYPRAVQVGRLVDHWNLGSIDVLCYGSTRQESSYRNKSDRCNVTVKRHGNRIADFLLRVATKFLSSGIQHRPDMQILWAKSSVKRLIKLIKEKDDPVLVSFGQPMSDHLAALHVKQKTGVPWIAHFSDPWADNPFSKRSLSSQSRVIEWERQVFENADKLVFTSDETVDLIMTNYPDSLRNKISVIPHTYSTKSLAKADIQNQDIIKIRYLGNLYGERNPIELVKALNAIQDDDPKLFEDMVFEFFGEMDNETRAAVSALKYDESLICFNGEVGYEKSLQLMADANLLLILDAPAIKSVFLPSKLVDYLGMAKPLLGITPPGTSANIIEDLGFPVCNSLDARQMKAPLALILHKIKQGEYRHSYNADRFHPEKVTQLMEELVSMVANKR